MPHVVIAGAGLSGLSLAYRLRQLRSDVRVTVLEKNDRPGGNIWTEFREGFRVELGPNGFLDAKPSTVRLCRDLGVGDRLIAASEASRKNRYLFLREKLQKLPGSPLSFLASPLLGWRGKVMLLTEPFRRRRPPPGDESVHDFAVRRAGKEVADVFADALVTGIQGGDPKLLSVRACFPRVAQAEREHGSVIRGFARAARQRRREAQARGEPPPGPQRMWSFAEGLRVLIERLRDAVTEGPAGDSAAPPGEVVTGVSVRRVERVPQGESGPAAWRVRGDGRDEWRADAVVLTSPAYAQAEALADLDAALAEAVGGIAYAPIAVVALGFRQADVPGAPDGFGYIAPQRTRRDLLGVQWCSAIYPGRAPEGCVLWRALCGGWNRPDILNWDDERLTAAVRRELGLAMGVSAGPVFRRVVRWPRAIPQYFVGHLDRVARVEAMLGRHPGLFLGGNAYHGIAMNDCTGQAEVLAARIAAYLG
ncbi:MAG TPA: protoporphyrinogen oxidase [Gemmataceae bacterium]